MALTPEEQAELDALKQEVGGLTLEEAQELDALRAEFEGGMPAGEEDSALQTLADFARGQAQGGTFGFADELAGLGGAALDLQGLSPQVEALAQGQEAVAQEASLQDPQMVAERMRAEGFSPQEIAEQLEFLASRGDVDTPSTYEVYRDRARRLDEEAAGRSPVANIAGQLGGALTTGAATGAASIPALAAEGALFGFGGAEGDPLEQLLSTAAGGATGALLGAGGKALGKGSQWLKEKLARGAEKQAVRALEPTTKQAGKIYDEARMGRMLLDEGVPARTNEKMAQRVTGLEREIGSQLDEFYDSIGGQGISNKQLQNALKARADKLSGKAANKKIVRELRDFADDIDATNKSVYKPSDIREERILVDDNVNWQSDAINQKSAREIRNVLRKEEDALIDKAAESGKGAYYISKEGLSDDFIDLKKRFGDAADAATIARQSSAREKSGMSLRDLLQGPVMTLTKAAVGNPKSAAARMMDAASRASVPTPSAGQINRLIGSRDPYSF